MVFAEYWELDHDAIWAEQAPDGHTIMLRHPSHPYEGPTDGTLPNDTSATLINFAAGYLRRVSTILGLPGILHGGGSEFVASSALAWLPVHEDELTAAPPDRSFSVWRYTGLATGAPTPVDRSVVILAVQSLNANDATQAIRSRLGIRIVAHLERLSTGRWKARITGVSVSTGLVGAPRPDIAPAKGFLQIFLDVTQNASRIHIENRIRAAAGLAPGTDLFIDGLRVVKVSGQRAEIEVYENAPQVAGDPQSIPYLITARFLVDAAVGPLPFLEAPLQSIMKCGLIADAGPVKGRVFPRDPASMAGIGALIEARPNRSPRRLKKYWKTRTLPGLSYGITCETDLIHDFIDVKRSRWDDKTADETLTQGVCPSWIRHPRANGAAAVHAYWNGHALFDTLIAYGLPPTLYFKYAALPLRIRYRAGINPGPGKDGKIVNARVTYDPPGCDLTAFDGGTLKPLQIKFALADLKRSASRREPLGLAGDPRWSWHEYGHVLLAASTGSTQLHFVHSTGDALAAIMWDPDSKLATHERMRGITFPWVYLSRHHDRDVFFGWSWTGRYHRASRFPTTVDLCRRKGYQSEQILSSSLFRLYRALGGDTALQLGTPPHPRRREAAAYTTYLIMRAIGMMGPASSAPVETPDELVSFLMDADVATLPVTSGPLAHRVGGYAHKVVRWAFEAQGLYTGATAGNVVDKPGKPVDPDVFINDLRPDSPGDTPRGGYMPVSLDWELVTNPARPPLWHAHPNAIQVVGDQVKVEVSARGPSTIPQVWVEVWWIQWPTTQPTPPDWNRATWTSLGTQGPLPVGPWPLVTTFTLNGLPTAPPNRRLLILASARCAGDPSNIDLSTGLPCSTYPTAIIDLVAGDNNLGLRRHRIP